MEAKAIKELLSQMRSSGPPNSYTQSLDYGETEEGEKDTEIFKEDKVEKNKSHKPVSKEKAHNLVAPVGQETMHNVVSPQPETETEMDLCKIDTHTKVSKQDKGYKTQVEVVEISPESELEEVAKDGTKLKQKLFTKSKVEKSVEEKKSNDGSKPSKKPLYCTT